MSHIGDTVNRVLTSWKIFIRDVHRLMKKPRVWIILLGVMITPALYSWINIPAFWDPYKNTGNLQIAVVNEDKGGNSDLTGQIKVGDQLVDQLKENHDLGWQFLPADEADEKLKAGKVYAEIKVPENFSQDIISIFQGRYEQPTLIYRPNEKINGISPQITKQGGSVIGQKVASAINKEVANAVVTQLKTNGSETDKKLLNTRDQTAGTFDEAANAVADGRKEVDVWQQSLDDARPTIHRTQDTLRSVIGLIDDAQKTLGQVQATSNQLNGQVLDFTASANNAYVQGSANLSAATATASGSVAATTAQLKDTVSRANTATQVTQELINHTNVTIGHLQAVLDTGVLPPELAQRIQDAINALKQANQNNQDLINNLASLKDNTNKTLDSVAVTADALNKATAESKKAADGLRDNLQANLPKLTASLNQINSQIGAFSSALDSQKALVNQSIGLLDGTDRQLSSAKDTLEAYKGNMSSIETGLRQSRADVQALLTGKDQDAFNRIAALDPNGVSTFLSQPVTVKSDPVYPIEHYGSGMAALFTNLSLWVGAFILVVIFRVEVDDEELGEVTVAQAYLGRLLLMGLITLFQTIIVSVGDIVLGVQHVSPASFIGTCVIVGLCYLSIIYSWVSTFGHIGRIVAVVLAFIQIVGASGLYPIEMMPSFFRAVNPVLPLTYGINGLRETIGGFYDHHYSKDMLILIAMALVAYMVGIALRRILSNVNLVVNRELEKGGLIIDEPVHIVGSGYRLADILMALNDREAYQDRLENRAKLLRSRYRIYTMIARIAAIIALVVLSVLAMHYPDQKALLFGLACLAMLAAAGTVAVTEYVRSSYAYSRGLGNIPEADLEDYAVHQTQHPRAYRLEGEDDGVFPITLNFPAITKNQKDKN